MKINEERNKSLICLALYITMLSVFFFIQNSASVKSFSNDYNEGVYLTSASALNNGHTAFRETFSSQPPLLIELLSIYFRIFGESVSGARTLAITSSILTILLTSAIAYSLFGPLAFLASAFFLCISPTFFLYAQTVQAEPFSLSMALAALCLMVIRVNLSASILAILGGITFAIAGLFKLFIAPMLAPLVLALALAQSPTGISAPSLSAAFACIRTKKTIWSITIFVLSGLSTTVLIAAFYDLDLFYDQAVHFHLIANRIINNFSQPNTDLLYKFFLENIGLCFLAVVGLCFLWNKRPPIATLLTLWICSDFFFLLHHKPLFGQHLVLLCPPLVIAASANLAWISIKWKNQSRGWFLIYLVYLPLVAATHSARTGNLKLNTTVEHYFTGLKNSFSNHDRDLVKLIKQRTLPGDPVVSDQQMHVFRAGRSTPAWLTDTSFVRIASGYLDDNEAISATYRSEAKMIVFWTGRLNGLIRYREWVRLKFVLVYQNEQQEIYISDQRNIDPYTP